MLKFIIVFSFLLPTQALGFFSLLRGIFCFPQKFAKTLGRRLQGIFLKKKGPIRGFFLEPVHFSYLNLCDIHFHKFAEHRGVNFSKRSGQGYLRGYQCNQPLESSQLQGYSQGVCGGIVPGNTIEVHWVYTSCPVKPGAWLGFLF